MKLQPIGVILMLFGSVLMLVGQLGKHAQKQKEGDLMDIGPLPSTTYKGCKVTSYTMGDYSDMNATIIMHCGSEDKTKGVVVQLLGKYGEKICSDGWEYIDIMGIGVDQHPSPYSFLNVPPWGIWVKMKQETKRGRCWEMITKDDAKKRGIRK